MDSFFDFDELLQDFDAFSTKFMRNIQKEFEEIEKSVKEGKLKGDWNVKRIDKPGMQGFIIQGRFWTDKPFGPFGPYDPFEPPKPLRRRPTFETPSNVPEDALKEIREPLTDVFDSEKETKVYVELPGEEESDIQLDFKDGKLEIKAKRFYKMLNLPVETPNKEKMITRYTNGILEVTIPKKQETETKYYKL